MSAELRKNRSAFIHTPILAEIVARLKAGELALAQYLGGKQACFPRTVVGLAPSFRRSLPETGCLSQGLPPGYASQSGDCHQSPPLELAGCTRFAPGIRARRKAGTA